MALTLDGLQNLLESADFRIEALNTPTSPGQPQVFEIRPSKLQLLPDTPSLPSPGESTAIDIPPIEMPEIDIPAFAVPNTIPPVIDIPPFKPGSIDIPPISLPASTIPIPSPIPTADILNAAEEVRISVEWQVEDLQGAIVEQDEAILWPGQRKTVPGGSGPTGPSGIGTVTGVATGEGAEKLAALVSSLQTTVMVLPDFVDLVRDFPPPPVKTLYLSATVTLSHRGLRAKLRLPRFPITVPALPIPTLAVFFATPQLGIRTDGKLQSGDQFLFIVVPANSPIGDLPGFRAILNILLKAMANVETIKTLAGLTGNVLPALGGLVDGAKALLRAVNAHVVGSSVGVAFAAADRISNLHDIDLIYRSPLSNRVFGANDTEAGDTISSLVFMAPPGRQLLCRQDTNYEGRGLLVATGDACIAIVNNLTKAPVAALPNAVAGLAPPTAHQSTDAPALDNSFSSMAFL